MISNKKIDLASAKETYFEILEKERVNGLPENLIVDSKNIFEMRKRYGFEIITKDYSEILDDKEIDAIYIATPNNFHFDQIKLAIKQKNIKEISFLTNGFKLKGIIKNN